MSTPLFPLAVWQSGTNENSIPANDNALRVQVLMAPAIDVADSEPGSPSEDDIHVIGTAWGGFTTDNVVIYKGGVWLEWETFEGWVKVIDGHQHYFDGTDWVLGGGGSGIPDAPSDGNTYGRRDGDWAQVPGGGGGGFDYFNATDYGATGDGATDDTAAVQAAIDAAEPVGGTVYFPRGTYILDPVYIESDNVRLLGEGRLSILKRKPATVTNTDSVGIVNAHGTSMNHLSGIVLERLAFDGNKANIVVDPGGDVYDVECTSFIFVDHGLIQQCWAYDSTSEGFDFDDCADCVVLDCTAENCDGYGVHFSNGCVRMRGRGCYAYNCGVAHERGGFDCYSGLQYSSYEDCHARSCYRGFVLGSEYNVLAGCTATACVNNGIRLTGDNNSVSGCRAHGTTSGNAMTITSSGNSVSGGVWANSASSSSGIVLTSGATNNTVTGAACRGNGGNGIRLSSGANNNTVTGCQTGVSIADDGTGNVLTGNVA